MSRRRRTNYELAHSIEVLLRRLVASGTTRDQTLAEDLIRDLDERLCPRPGGGIRIYDKMNFKGTSADPDPRRRR